MENSTWLSAEAFAEFANISHQAARRALRLAFEGQAWRGQTLDVRLRPGSGGRARWGYEIRSSSLPTAAHDKRHHLASPIGVSLAKHSTAALAEIRWRIIRLALDQPPGSPARGEAVADAAVGCGRSARTLYRWIKQYEAQGFRGLTRARPSNAGQPRIIVSQAFDRACIAAGHDERDVKAIAASVHNSLKGLWASRAELAGVREVRRLAEFALMEACEARGIAVPKSAMRLSRRTVERFAHYRVVNQRRNDRKAFDDAKPRIKRDWTALAPMERVVGDVKHLDVVVSRDDGSHAWPKIVAFMDAGTGRVFVHPVLLDRGEGVRQEHVIEAFLAMAADPQWGFPQGLYLDNGSEMAALAKIASVLELINEPGARTIIYARPYNAAAKPIESLFARLDRYVFSQLPGYAGPNRMAKKTQTVGRPPKPYPGSWDSFRQTVKALIEAHNNRPVGGQWADRSPNDWLRSKVQTGWRPVQVEPLALDTAFCDRDSRRVDRGVIRLRGDRYSCAELYALPSRTVVDLALPWRRDAAPLFRSPGGDWIYLERERAFPAAWQLGAREAGRRQAAQSRHVAHLARDAPRVDPVAMQLRWSARQEPVALAPSRHTLDLGEPVARVTTARTQDPPVPGATSELRRQREMAITERLEAVYRRAD